MRETIKIFGTGTMRSGGTLVSNILSLSDKVKVFSECVYFARHIYDKNLDFNDLNELFKISNNISNRIYFRNDLYIPALNFYLNFINSNIKNFSQLYNSLMKTFLESTSTEKKNIVLEYSNGEWRFIETFLKINNKYKAFHIIRDPRAVVSSFKKISFGDKYDYLYGIFNWLDSYNYYLKYKKKFNTKRYLFLKFEDIHNYPKLISKKILDFANLPFDNNLMNNSYWKKKLLDNNSYVNFSAYNNLKQYGFNKKRINNWQNNLKKWEISLIQNLLDNEMSDLGYDALDLYEDKKLFKDGLKKIRSVKKFKRYLDNLINKSVGSNKSYNDPRKYYNWSSKKNPKKKFINDIESKFYIKNLEKIRTINSKIIIKKKK